MSLHAVIKEIASVTAFFQNRGETKDIASLQKSFTDGLLQKLKLVPNFGTSEGAQLHEALTSSMFGESQTQRIRETIDAMVQSCTTKAPAAGSAQVEGPKQMLKHWVNYFTADELEYLRGRAGFTAKMTLMVERAMDVGCVKPQEDTYRYCLAMLLACHYTSVPAPQEIYQKVQELKQSWVSEAKPFYLDHIQDFPEHPTDLPQKVFEHAYPDKQPVSVTLQGLNTIADSIPLRGNSKLLKQSRSRIANTLLEDAYSSIRPSSPSVKHEQVAPAVKHEPEYDADDDPDVIVLRKEFEFKLAQLKASKMQHHGDAPVKHEEQSAGPISISRTSTGKLHVEQNTSRESREPTTPVKAEPSDTPAGATVDAEPRLEDLDPWTRAAVEALQARNKGNQAKKKEAAQSAIAKKPDVQPASVKKRPSADLKETKKEKNVKKETKTKKHTKTETSKKAPKIKKDTKIKTEDDDEVPKSKIMAAMPKGAASAAPVRYWGGVIYTATKAKKFRALKERGNNNSEASASWGGDKPTKEAWRKCVKAIEDHHP